MVNSGSISRPKFPTARWGAACGTCAAAKAKCMRTNPVLGSKCERCERLLKDCTDQIHRPRKKRTVKPSKTAQLEERLEGLFHLLKQNGSLGTNNVNGLTPDSSSITDELASVLSAHHSNCGGSPQPLGFLEGSRSWTVPETYNSKAPPSCICRPDGGESPPPPVDDEAALKIFREELQHVLPFVIVPPHITVSDLKTSRPFLMASIRLVASYRSLRSMRAQMFHLLKHVSDYMLIRSERSFDMLLGLLVIIQWYPYHFCVHSQFGYLLSLTANLISQLCLDRRPLSAERMGVRAIKPGDTTYSRTNEERRAYAGAWLVASVCSIGFWKAEPMTHVRYLDECLNELEADAEYDSDAKLVHLVRIQCLSQQISRVNSTGTDAEDVYGPDPKTKEAQLAALEADLELARTNIPDSLQDDPAIRMHLNTALLKLHEPPIVDREMVGSLCAAISANNLGQPSALDRIYKGRQALAGWFENWFSLPADKFHQKPTMYAAQLTYAIVLVGRWTKLSTPRSMTRGFKKGGHATVGPPIDHPVTDCLKKQQPTSTKSIDLPNASSYLHRAAERHPLDLCESISRQQEADPRLTLELAALRAHIESQPESFLDVPQLITSIVTRFEEMSTAMQDVSVDPGPVVPNVWSMGAVRVRITKSNLEKWAEVITEGIEKANLDDSLPVGTSAASGGQGGFSGGMLGLQDAQGATTPWNSVLQQDQTPGQDYGQPYGMSQNFDPNLWIQGSWDWDAMIDSMGYMAHD